MNYLTMEHYHIVKCVVNITYHYLTQGRSLVVSWSAANNSEDETGHSLIPRGDVTDALLMFMKTLNHRCIIPIEISSPGRKNIEFQLYDYEKHDSYLFFVWHQEKFGVIRSLTEQLEELKDSGSWNPSARFFVVVTERSQQDTQFIAQVIAETLYRTYGAMDVLILIPGTSEKIHGSDVLAGTSENTNGSDMLAGTNEKTNGSDILSGTSEKTNGSDIILRKSRTLHGHVIAISEMRVKTDILDLTAPFGLYTWFRESNRKTREPNAIPGISTVTERPDLISEWLMKTDGHVTTTTLDLYSWIPYQSVVSCVEISVSLLDKWILDDDGRFVKQAQLFPDKFPRNLHGCPLRVRPNLVPPIYVDLTGNYTNGEGTVTYNYTGLEVEYVRFLAQVLDANIVYSPALKDDSVEARIQSFISLQEGLIDVAFGGMPLHPMGLRFADPTLPYFSDILKWYVPCGKPVPRMQSVARLFSSSLCVALLLVFLLSLAVFWMLSKRADMLGLQEAASYKQISSCFYAMWAVALCVPVPQQPRYSFSRAVFLVLVWHAFIVSTTFQTLFTSIIVDPGMTKQLRTLEELLQSDHIYVYNEHFDSFVRESSPSYYNEINLSKKECTYKLDCQTDFLSNDNIVTTGFYIYTDYYVLAALPSGSRSPKLCVLEDDIFILHFGLYLSKGSPLTNTFNTAIFRAIESGFIVKLTEDFEEVCRFTELQDTTFNRTALQESAKKSFVFSVRHLIVPFCFLGVGCSVSVLVFLGELLQYGKSK
jgi:hypothetical protein